MPYRVAEGFITKPVMVLFMLKTTGPDLSPILKSKEPILAVFYAEWCPFCRAFIPEFESVKPNGFELAKVDLSDWENPLWEEFKVDVVPTLIAFKNGEVIARRDGVLGKGLQRKDLDEFLLQLKKT